MMLLATLVGVTLRTAIAQECVVGENAAFNTTAIKLGLYAAKEDSVCIVQRNSSLVCWGTNGKGQFGTGTTTGYSTPIIAGGTQLGTNVKQVSIGYKFVCVIMTDDSVRCAGEGSRGQMGDNTNIDRTVFSSTSIRGYRDFNMNPIKVASITNGYVHACALFFDGRVGCWGGNEYYQLCNYHASDTAVPERKADLGFGAIAIQIAAGGWHTCAILSDNSVKCWGRGNQGQLGYGDTGNQNSPANVNLGTGRTAVSIALGYYHTCALLDDGSVKCWGYNAYGQLGYGDTDNRGDQGGEMGDALPAVSLGAGRTAVSIAAGTSHTCAVLDNGSVKCWGWNGAGQLGNESSSVFSSIPSLTNLNLQALSVTASSQNTCALLSDLSFRCWGYYYTAGYGGPNDNIGDAASELGAYLPPLNVHPKFNSEYVCSCDKRYGSLRGTFIMSFAYVFFGIFRNPMTGENVLRQWGQLNHGLYGANNIGGTSRSKNFWSVHNVIKFYSDTTIGPDGEGIIEYPSYPVELLNHADSLVTGSIFVRMNDNSVWGAHHNFFAAAWSPFSETVTLYDGQPFIRIIPSTVNQKAISAVQVDYHLCVHFDDATVRCSGHVSHITGASAYAKGDFMTEASIAVPFKVKKMSASRKWIYFLSDNNDIHRLGNEGTANDRTYFGSLSTTYLTDSSILTHGKVATGVLRMSATQSALLYETASGLYCTGDCRKLHGTNNEGSTYGSTCQFNTPCLADFGSDLGNPDYWVTAQDQIFAYWNNRGWKSYGSNTYGQLGWGSTSSNIYKADQMYDTTTGISKLPWLNMPGDIPAPNHNNFFSGLIASDNKMTLWLAYDAETGSLGVYYNGRYDILDFVNYAWRRLSSEQSVTSLPDYSQCFGEYCAAGQYDDVESGCSDCPLGTYTDLEFNYDCFQCEDGLTTDQVGSTECTPPTCNVGEGFTDETGCAACEPGTFNNAEDLSPCELCAVDTFAAGSGATVCEACGANEGTNDLTGRTVCICAPGYTREGGVCVQCAAGTSKGAFGDEACTACAADSISIAGATECSACASNSVTVGDDRTDCVCVAGYVFDGTVCSACPEGEFKATISDSDQCAMCPHAGADGYTRDSITLADATETCTECPLNSGVIDHDHTQCYCDASFYDPDAYSSRLPTCVACPDGSTSAAGATECVFCPANEVEIDNVCQCVAGYTRVDGTCQPCALGEFKADAGDGACAPCAEDTYAGLPPATSCTACPANSDTNGLSGQFRCFCQEGHQPNNTLAADEVLSECFACAAGMFKAVGDNSLCQNCAVNTFSDAPAASSCTPCHDFSGTRGLQGATFCECVPGYGFNATAESGRRRLLEAESGSSGNCTTDRFAPPAEAMRNLLKARPPLLYNNFADFDGAKVRDRMGNGFDVTLTAGSASVVDETLAGSAFSTKVLQGGAATKFLWPPNSLPAHFTICASWYNTNGVGLSTRKDSEYSSILLGGLPTGNGIFRLSDWVDEFVYLSSRDNAALPSNSWMVFCMNTVADSSANLFMDHQRPPLHETDANHALFTNPLQSSQLMINYHPTTADFKMHSVLVWDSELSAAQMRVATAALRAQLGGVPFGAAQAVPAVPDGVTSGFFLPKCVVKTPPARRPKIAKVKVRAKIPMSKAAFEAVQDKYIAGVARAAGVEPEDVTIVSIKEVSLAGRRLLQETGVEVETSVQYDDPAQLETASTDLSSENLSTELAADGITVDETTTPEVTSTQTVGVCIPCDPGSYKSNDFNTPCSPCGIGAYTSEPAATTCTNCDVGTSTAVTGSVECDCDAGYEGESTLESNTCAQCPTGQFKAIVDDATCGPCANGTFANQTGFEECLACPVNTFANLVGTVTCTRCGNNSFSAGGSDQCTCIDGWVSSTTYLDHPPHTEAEHDRQFYSLGEHCIPCPEFYCVAGQYQDGVLACSDCPPFSNSSDFTRFRRGCDCWPGYGDPGDQSCAECEIGYYKNWYGMVACNVCPHNQTTNQTKSTACVCEAGYGRDLTNALVRDPYAMESCLACQPGYFKGALGDALCDACPTNTFSRLPGAQSCDTCPGEELTSHPGSPECSCAPGYELLDNADVCTTCPQGYFKTTIANETCSACPLNTYLPTRRGTECVACPANSLTEDVGAASCTCVAGYEKNIEGICVQCAPGTARLDTGNTSCTACGIGFIAPDAGSLTCTSCGTGRTTLGEGATECVCAAGWGFDNETQGCSKCPINTFKAAAGDDECEPCAPGEVAVPGSTECGNCPVNQSLIPGTADCGCAPGYGLQEDGSCQMCAPGTNKTSAGSVPCTPCPANLYQSHAGALQCLACHANSVSAPGATACACAAGHFLAELQECAPCAPGSAKATVGDELCLLCAAGSYSSLAGSLQCESCAAFELSDEGATDCVCEPGYGFDTDTGLCTACAPGSAKASAGDFDCSLCDAGTFQGGVAALTCETCAEFLTSLSGAETCVCAPGRTLVDGVCEACAAGTAKADLGNGACSACDVGYFSDAGSALCLACPSGASTAAPGSATCVCVGGFEPVNASGPLSCSPCHPGYAKDGLQNVACAPCEDGFFAASAGSDSCTACPGPVQGETTSRYVTDGLAGTECLCAPGRFRDPAQEICLLCPADTFAARANNDPLCELCGENMIAPRGADACVCAAGSAPGHPTNNNASTNATNVSASGPEPTATNATPMQCVPCDAPFEKLTAGNYSCQLPLSQQPSGLTFSFRLGNVSVTDFDYYVEVLIAAIVAHTTGVTREQVLLLNLTDVVLQLTDAPGTAAAETTAASVDTTTPTPGAGVNESQPPARRLLQADGETSEELTEVAVFIQLLESDDVDAIVQRLNDAAFAATTNYFVQSLDKLAAGAELTTQEEEAAAALQNAVASSPVIDQALQQFVVQMDDASVAGVGATRIIGENAAEETDNSAGVILFVTLVTASFLYCVWRCIKGSPEDWGQPFSISSARYVSQSQRQAASAEVSLLFQNMKLPRTTRNGGTAQSEACTYGEARAILGAV